MYCKCVYSDCLPSCVSHCMLMRLNETLALATSLVCAYAYTYVRVSCTYVRTTALRCTYVYGLFTLSPVCAGVRVPEGGACVRDD